jgi:hypothetical protein
VLRLMRGPTALNYSIQTGPSSPPSSSSPAFLSCSLARSRALSRFSLSHSLSLFSRYLVGCRRTSSHLRRPNGVGGRVCQEADVQRAMVASLSTLRFLFVAVDVTGSPSPPLTPPRDDGRQDADAELSPSDSASHHTRQDVC